MAVSPEVEPRSSASAAFGSRTVLRLPRRRPSGETVGGQRPKYTLGGTSVSLTPNTSNPPLRQPPKTPANFSFKISDPRDSTARPGKVFQSLTLPAVRANRPF